MSFQCGLVGLPNAGKSTLFNALTKTQLAKAENFPFCTIDPNTGQVPVPDPRLVCIAELAASARTVPARMEFVDIAGLVRGASKGEGLGNQFLSHIRQTEAVALIVRCFEDPDITHVDDSVDPVRDIETVETELLLGDIQTLERLRVSSEKKAKRGDPDSALFLETARSLLPALNEGEYARTVAPKNEEEADARKRIGLLTDKPVIYVANVDETGLAKGHPFSGPLKEKIGSAPLITVCAQLEAEIALFDEEERKDFLEDFGFKETGLDALIRMGYDQLNLINFFTAGPKEARSWTIEKGTCARKAARKIHTDIERGFICAETISYEDYIENNGEEGARENGKIRKEGKDYIVQNGDVILFRFNV